MKNETMDRQLTYELTIKIKVGVSTGPSISKMPLIRMNNVHEGCILRTETDLLGLILKNWTYQSVAVHVKG